MIPTLQLYKFHRKMNNIYADIKYIPIATTIRNRGRFIGTKNEKPLLLDAVSFKGMDLSRVEFHNVQWLKSKDYARLRNTIIDERVLGKIRTYEDVSKIYHQLRKNYELTLRFDEASDFFVGEMESVRKSLSHAGFKGSCKSAIYFLYKIVGLYGESVFRPLVVLTPVLIVGFALARLYDCDDTKFYQNSYNAVD
jgi:hypothetical protein